MGDSELNLLGVGVVSRTRRMTSRPSGPRFPEQSMTVEQQHIWNLLALKAVAKEMLVQVLSCVKVSVGPVKIYCSVNHPMAVKVGWLCAVFATELAPMMVF